MNLIVSTRTESRHLRFEVDGRWTYGDALKLAYLLKAAQGRASLDRFLLDLRRVTSDPASDEKFLVCDRLRRLFQPPVRIALVCDATLIDSDTAAHVTPDTARIAVFVREREALAWLMA
ncbi:MAG: hypothetical protein NVS3B2_08010 [Ramlibacter sp.]